MRLLILVVSVVAALSAAVAVIPAVRRMRERGVLDRRRQVCPRCGGSALSYSTEEQIAGSGESVGQGTMQTTADCEACGFRTSWDAGWAPVWYHRASEPPSRVEREDRLPVTVDPPAATGDPYRLRAGIDLPAAGQEFYWSAVPFRGVVFVVDGHRHTAGEGQLKTQTAEIDVEPPTGEVEIFVDTRAPSGRKKGSLKLTSPP